MPIGSKPRSHRPAPSITNTENAELANIIFDMIGHRQTPQRVLPPKCWFQIICATSNLALWFVTSRVFSLHQHVRFLVGLRTFKSHCRTKRFPKDFCLGNVRLILDTTFSRELFKTWHCRSIRGWTFASTRQTSLARFGEFESRFFWAFRKNWARKFWLVLVWPRIFWLHKFAQEEQWRDLLCLTTLLTPANQSFSLFRLFFTLAGTLH